MYGKKDYKLKTNYVIKNFGVIPTIELLIILIQLLLKIVLKMTI